MGRLPRGKPWCWDDSSTIDWMALTISQLVHFAVPHPAEMLLASDRNVPHVRSSTWYHSRAVQIHVVATSPPVGTKEAYRERKSSSEGRRCALSKINRATIPRNHDREHSAFGLFRSELVLYGRHLRGPYSSWLFQNPIILNCHEIISIFRVISDCSFVREAFRLPSQVRPQYYCFPNPNEVWYSPKRDRLKTLYSATFLVDTIVMGVKAHSPTRFWVKKPEG
jgi:hypothetical protein